MGLTSASASAWENDPSVSLAMVITTSNGQPTNRAVTVRYATVNNSAVAGADFVGVNATFTFATGTPSGTSVPGAVTIVNDTAVEPAESFTLTLAAETAGVSVTTGAAVVTLYDDDQVYVRFSPSSSSVAETAGSAPITVLVTTDRGTPTTRPVTVSYGTVAGTATAGLDYVSGSGTLTILAGTPSGTPIGTAIQILDDAMWENAETFAMTLSAPGAVADPPHTVTIVNNDTLAYYQQVDLTPSVQAVWEYAGSMMMSIVVTTYNGQPTTAPITLSFATVHEWGGPNPATPNVDYQAFGQAGTPPGSFTIAAGTPSGTVISAPILIGNDPTDEPNEWFQFRITPSASATSMVPLQGDWIYDDDPGPFGAAARRLDSLRADGQSASGITMANPPAPATPQAAAIAPAQGGTWTVGERRVDTPQALTWTVGAKQR